MRNVERICIQDVLVCFLPSSVINIQQFWKALKGTAQLLRIKKESMFIGINSNNSLLLFFFFFPIHNINYPSRTQGGGGSVKAGVYPLFLQSYSLLLPLYLWRDGFKSIRFVMIRLPHENTAQQLLWHNPETPV